MASLIFGDVFRLLSPWRAIGRAAGWVAARAGASDLTEPLPYPPRLGRWPAVAGLVGFAAVELCWGKGDDPTALAILALAYMVVQLVGMGIYGVEPWSRRGDAFGVYFGAIATLAPFARRSGRLVARPPATGAPAYDPLPAGSVALLVAGIGSTTFDGAKEGPLFGAVAPRLQDLFTGIGASKGTALEVAFLIGLLAAIAIVGAVYALGVTGMRTVRSEGKPVPDLARRFAHTLIPIAAAYLVAHYFSLLAYNGQTAWALLSDPLGDGSDLFGAASSGVDYGVISATGIWYVQVAALLIGHVTALALAHDRALVVWGSVRDATRSQLWMLGVMVAFTGIGLWQLSVANT
jgi:hypothetical protein